MTLLFDSEKEYGMRRLGTTQKNVTGQSVITLQTIMWMCDNFTGTDHGHQKHIYCDYATNCLHYPYVYLEMLNFRHHNLTAEHLLKSHRPVLGMRHLHRG